jgi:hypothetical protein
MMRLWAFALVGAIGLLLGGAGKAQAANVAYIHASGGSVSYLTGFGHTVTHISNPVGLTLAQLAGFDVIMIASNSIFSEPTNIGNVAADFADSGRGVVLTQFVFQGVWALGGKIMQPNYTPITKDPLSSGYAISSNLGVIFDPANPMFAGVNTANVKTNFQANSLVNPGANLVANWAGTNRPAIAYRCLTDSSIVALNLFPDGSWTTDPDTRRLVANAITFSQTCGDVNVIPEPGTLTLAGLGAIGLFGYARKRRKQQAALAC